LAIRQLSRETARKASAGSHAYGSLDATRASVDHPFWLVLYIGAVETPRIPT
jgi:hypothetical protein